jgi:phosphate transport system substrate-binding protein
LGDLVPLGEELAAAFNRSQRGVTVSVRPVSQNQLASAVSSDPLAMALAYAIPSGQAFSQTVVALEAIAVTVPLTNPVETLSIAEVRQAFAGSVSDWSELGGRPQAIIPLSREDGALSRVLFERWVITPGTRVSRNALVLVSDEAVVATLASMPGSIGYASLRSLTAQVRPVRLEGVPPSVAAIQQGQYPLVLPVLVLTAGQPRSGAKEFLSFVQGRDGQTVLQAQGFVKAK